MANLSQTQDNFFTGLITQWQKVLHKWCFNHATVVFSTTSELDALTMLDTTNKDTNKKQSDVVIVRSNILFLVLLFIYVPLAHSAMSLLSVTVASKALESFNFLWSFLPSEDAFFASLKASAPLHSEGLWRRHFRHAFRP